MPAPTATPGLVDRYVELEALDGLVEATRAGSSGVLVLRGESGIGKTALLDEAARRGADLRVLRVQGVRSEVSLSYGSLHQLLGPLLDRIDGLPAPQSEALGSAFGRVSRSPSSAFLVGLGALTLLSDAAERRPILCLVDDADDVDDATAQVLGFTARRLGHESVLMLLAIEDGAVASPFADLRTLELEGLSRQSSRELLDGALGSGLDLGVRERLAGELAGNPLALLEVARELTPAQVRGRTPLPETLPRSERLETSLLRQVRELPVHSQRLLLVVAAERSGDPDLLWRAAGRLGIDRAALAPAEPVLRTGTQLTFRHTLVRAAVYASASEEARRETHLALAASMDPVLDRERTAWHRAAAASEPDEALAAELEWSSEAAREKGGFATAGAFLELAARVTPEAGARAGRALDAAEAHLTAGSTGKAASVFSQVSIDELDAPHLARAAAVGARLGTAQGDAYDSRLLLDAARALEPVDAARARSTYLQAVMLALFAGRLGTRDGLRRAAQAARRAPPAPAEETAEDLLLDGFGLLLTTGHAKAAPVLRRGVDLAIRSGTAPAFASAYQAAFELWDDEALRVLSRSRVQQSRASGALPELANALSQHGAYELLLGRFDAAEACFAESEELSSAIESSGLLAESRIGALILAAWQGDETHTRELVHVCTSAGTARGLGAFVGFARYALAVLELGLGNYEAALAAAQDACLDPVLLTRTLPEVAEAAARAGEHNAGTEAVRLLGKSTGASRTEWGLGVLARSQALVAPHAEAEPLYLEAIDHLKRCRATTQLARTQLVYGEWLRRRQRRRDAREQLRTAHELLDWMGAAGFAHRAETELVATGERARRRRPETALALTPQERRIAQLVSEGATNAEVAAQLYLSVRTVEYHLGKVFKKLGVTSRTELAHTLLLATPSTDT